MATSTNTVQEHFKKHLGPYLLAVGLLLALLFMIYQNSQLRRDQEEQVTALRRQVQTNQLTNDRQQLTLGIKTFAWAVRNALLQNKTGEINEYFNTLVQNKGVREVLLVDPSGKVQISTNKKNEGVPYANRFPAYLLQQESVYFSNKAPYEISAPIMSPTRRLGTLVMFYNPTSVLPDSLNR